MGKRDSISILLSRGKRKEETTAIASFKIGSFFLIVRSSDPPLAVIIPSLSPSLPHHLLPGLDQALDELVETRKHHAGVVQKTRSHHGVVKHLLGHDLRKVGGRGEGSEGG